ncbi:hypothetical protein GA0115259_106764 [Streptomyces sp. MnatMP-M17]|nr:hypothetical protein GA0115259_106764 [Streptomyces sp. MnatMP-M17]
MAAGTRNPTRPSDTPRLRLTPGSSPAGSSSVSTAVNARREQGEQPQERQPCGPGLRLSVPLSRGSCPYTGSFGRDIRRASSRRSASDVMSVRPLSWTSASSE